MILGVFDFCCAWPPILIIKNNNVGILTENETTFFKHIFQKFYTPDKEDIKFNVEQISNVNIVTKFQ